MKRPASPEVAGPATASATVAPTGAIGMAPLDLDPNPPIGGHCDPHFAAVADAFRRNFAENQELGAAVAVYVGDRLVVDLWGGYCDRSRDRPWQRDTLVCGFSLAKTLAAECVHVLVEQGLIELDHPVARYWPEFAAADKAEITIRQVLCHQAGLPAIEKPMAPWSDLDWDGFTSALAQQKPWWPPGSAHGYHVGTYGHLCGEIVRRVSGQSFADFFHHQVAGPLDMDAHVAFGPELDHRVATFVQAIVGKLPRLKAGRERLLIERVYDNPYTVNGAALADEPPYEKVPANERAWRGADNPGNGIHLTARAMAAYCAMHVGRGVGINGRRIFSPATIASAVAEHCRGTDAVLKIPTCFALGFKRWQRQRTIGPQPEQSYFANGLGGSIAIVDPAARMSFAYVMNTPLRASFLTYRNVPLIEACYQSLGATS